MCSCLQCPQLSELVLFVLWELSMTFYIFHRHAVCLVDCVDLICILYSWWEGFGSSSLATLPLGSNCGFISTSAYGLSTGVWSWGFPGGLGFAPVRAWCGGGTAAWVSGVLAAPATPGSWQLGKQEIKCSKMVWQPVATSIGQYAPVPGETPLMEKPGRPQSTGSTKNWTEPKWPYMHRHKAFFFFLPVAAQGWA